MRPGGTLMGSGPDLASLLDELALASPGVERRATGDLVEYSTGGRPFATRDGEGRTSFRLRSDVGRAALGTPDVSASSRGPDWIVLAPVTADRFARDRATAWFEHARKQAAEERPPH